MSILDELNLSTPQMFNSALGSILSNKEYRGKLLNIAQTQLLIDAGVNAKWQISSANLDRINSNPALKLPETVVVADPCNTDDYRLAAYYVNKVKSSIDRGIDFDLSLSDVKRLWRRTTCYYTNVPLTTVAGQRNTRTLDRIDHTKGYTKDNTVVCSYFANQLKNELFERPNGEFRIEPAVLVKMLAKLGNM